MTTMDTGTVTATIDVPPITLSTDLANPSLHPAWATDFFTGEAVDNGDGTWRMNSPRMGGSVRFRIDAVVEYGIIDMYLAPEGAPFGPPLPVRVVPNGDGSDVLFTLTRFPGQTEDEWAEGLSSMARELENLKRQYEV